MLAMRVTFSQEKKAGSWMHEVMLGYVCRVIGSCSPGPGSQYARAFVASDNNRANTEFMYCTERKPTQRKNRLKGTHRSYTRHQERFKLEHMGEPWVNHAEEEENVRDANRGTV